ncbi:MAG: hypothetical protein JW784_02285 [Candidatus Cloacimonetes bacterium]|nr:hypothetical protein [Candidatus Cloacimonadota bacterium]
MEEKSKQQMVFDWLMKNPEVLFGEDNTKLYKKFGKSGLPRNRLRSYKSRLKEKVDKGEVDLENPFSEKIKATENHPESRRYQLFFGIGKIFGILVILILAGLLFKHIRKSFRD